MSSNNIEAAYPLSPMQQGMLFHSLAAPESGFYVTQLVYTLDHLNVAAFARAWQRVVDRHAVLRTAFAWERIEKPLQVVGRRVKLSPGQHDLRGLTPAEQEQRIAAYLEAEQRRGFKLSQAPLMRLALFQLAEETYRFVWVYHHILLDGWSLPLVLQEVLALYTAFCRGQDLDLEPPRPFREYIAWLQRQDLSAAEAFWRQQLAGFRAPTALVVDTPPDGAAGEERYAEQETRVAPALTGALQALARRQHLTLSTIMQGAWALLLSRYSGEPDVLFGAPMSGRPADLPGVETMIGLFINTLPVRIAAAPEAMLLPWLKAIQDQHVRLRHYEYSPLLEIQRWSEVPRDRPLFESILAYENYPIDAALAEQGAGLAIRQVQSVQRVHYPLVVVVQPASELSLHAYYDCRRFDDAVIARLLGHLQTLLEGIAADPQRRLSALPLLTAAERQQLLVAWNDTRADYPQDRAIHQLFEDQAARVPDAVALVFDRGQGSGVWGQGTAARLPPPAGGGTEGGAETRRQESGVRSQESEFLAPNTQHPTPNTQHLTYRELNQRANRLAHHLQSLGAGLEARVGIMVERSAELVVGLLGVLKAGGAYVPLDPAYPQERLAFMLEDAQVAVLLTTTDHRPSTNPSTRLRAGDQRPFAAAQGRPTANPSTSRPNDEDKSRTNDDRSAYGYDRSYPNDDRSTINDDPPAYGHDISCPNDDRSTINDDPPAYGHDISCPNDERSAINDERSAINDDRSAYGHDISCPNDDRSAINDDPPAYRRDLSRPNDEKATTSELRILCLDADWSLIAQAATHTPSSRVTSSNLAYAIYTSGSTGRPKGALVTHSGLCNLSVAQIQTFAVGPADRVLQFASLSFDASIFEIVMALRAGATLCMSARDRLLPGPALLALLRDEAITTVTLPPSALAVLPSAELPALRTIVVAGEPCDAALAARWGAGRRFFNAYGPTEATVWATVAQWSGGAPPIGRPIANVQVYLLDSQHQPVPVGVPGELYIGGAGLARGYLGRPDLTAERFIPNPFAEGMGDGGWGMEDASPSPIPHPPSPGTRLYKTGDLARYRPDGMIEFLGRIDQQVKLRGFRIEVGEIETVLGQHPAVRERLVLAREDVPGDRRLVAYVVPKIEDRGLKIEDSGSDTPDPLSSILYPLSSELRSFLKERLPDYMIPAAFVVLEALPLTPNGKIDRRALPPPEGRPALDAAFVEPRTAVERTIAAVWQAVLHAEQVGVRDNFFDLGGHSLHLLQVQGKLREALGRAITAVDLFRYPTVGALAAYLSPSQSAPSAPGQAAVPVPTPAGAPDIAIIGMSGRFPGADSVEAFWRNLRDGVESINFFSDEELLAAGASPDLLDHPAYVKAGAWLPDIEYFDAAFFGYTPREAEFIDPQQRLFLECAWHALEHAGYDSERYPGRIGVYAGVGANNYLVNFYSNRDLVESMGAIQTALGNEKDHLTTRISYKLNLRGPSVNVQTACSTSLVAVHLAARSLLAGECAMALAGGISISPVQRTGYLYQEGGYVSPDGHCRAFDARSQGTVSSSGVGVVVLKRLADALADGDTIYALIKGSAINNDGALRVGYTAPSVDGQVEVIAEALANAGVAPETIGYVETHGTGTPLGDPIEVAALTQVFGGAARAGTCAIGSLKTNVGHMDSAAGVAGLIKTALALQHRQIPPSLHFESPNPNIDFAGSPFYVNTRLADWPADGAPRRAGVSSFGIGGTNAHVVLEEPPAVAPGGASRPWQLLLLSARTETALETATERLIEHLKAHPDLDLADVAYTLQMGRRAFNQRRMLVCRDRDDALAALEARDAQRVISGFQEPADRPIAFMFPGGGAQYANMAADLYRTEALFREMVDQCAELLKPRLGLDLREVLYPDERPTTNDERPTTNDQRHGDAETGVRGQRSGVRSQGATAPLPPPAGGGTEGGRSQESDISERQTQHSKLNTQNSSPNTQHPTPNTLERTSLALPALFVVEYALARLWMSWGVQPRALIGHSLGEYVAACLAGVLSLEDALALVALRGQLFERLPQGAMLSVPLAEEQLLPLLGADLSLAAVNGPALCVVSGAVEAIDRIAGFLAEQGVDVGRLHIAVAAHSALVEPILDTFAEFVATLPLQAPRIPYISNVSGTWISAAEATDPSYWVRHLRQTVRFAAGVQELLKEPNRILLEVGPGQTLSTLARQQPDAGAGRVILTSLRHPRERQPDVAFLLNKVGQLWLAGAALDWNGFYRAERRRRLPLPTYPFERQRYWIERQHADNGRSQRLSLQKRPDIADWFYTPVWTQSPPAVEAGEPEQQTAAWLIFADPCGVGAQLQHALERAGQHVTYVTIGQQFAPIGERAYTLDPRRPEDYDALLQALRAHDTFPGMIVHLWSITPESDAPADLERLEWSQELGFYSLLFLAQALGKQQAPVQIAVVSNNMHEVAGEEIVRPEKATVLGPCKVIPHEYPNITCRSIDLALPAPGSWQSERLMDDLVAELTSQASDAVVAYHHNHRWVQRFEPVRLNGAGRSARLREGGVYLITGGLGGIGLVLAEHLAQAARARLVLFGRSTPPERERWDEWLEEHGEQDRTSRTIRQVRAIEALGAEVLLVSADVADEQQMRAAIARAYERFGTIHGVIHAAGVAGGGIMQIKAPELAARVLAPKVRGTLVLDALFKDARLDFFVLCSSLNALLGAIGQVDHCGANAFLDAFARRQAGGQAHFTVAINWPAWQEVGQVVDTAVPDELKAWREENIKQGILSKQGVEVFRRVLGCALPQVIVSPRDFQAEVEQNNAFSAANSLKELEQALLSRPTHPRPQLGTGYVAPKEGVEQVVAGIWQKLLGIEQVGRHDDFFQLGGHSLLATQLMSRLRDAFQLELPLQSLFETPTVAGVAALIAQKQAEQADSEKLAQLLAEIRQLSPDQAQSILTAERQVIREGQTYE